MAKTRDQMVTIVADALGKSQSATAVSGALLSTRCVDFLNWGQDRICRAYSFDELDILNESAATVASVKVYPLTTGTNNLGLTRPKDISSIRLIDSENSIKLVRWSDRKFDRVYPRPANFATGRPRIYIRWGSNLEFFKIPDAVYSLAIRYPQWAAELSSTSSTSSFEYKDQLIITSGILEGYLHFEEYNDADVWLQKFLGLLSDCIRAEGDTDWETQADEFSMKRGGYYSGEPWIDPYGQESDPLHSYAD